MKNLTDAIDVNQAISNSHSSDTDSSTKDKISPVDRHLLLMASLSFCLRKLRHNQSVTRTELLELSALGDNAGAGV
jgi:hypothetical protein